MSTSVDTTCAQRYRWVVNPLMARILATLINSTEPLSGRRISMLVQASPTAVNRALQELARLGGVQSEKEGRSILWSTSSQAAALLDPPGQNDRPERTALIVTAVQLEHWEMQQHLLNVEVIRGTRGERFTKGILPGRYIHWRVLLTQVGMGSATTASMVGHAVESQDAHVAVFMGTAATLKPEDLPIGDVIAASKVYNAHAGKQVPTNGASLLLTRPSAFPTASGLTHLTRSVIAHTDWNPATPRRRGSPKAILAPIASVEAVQTDPSAELVTLIRSNYNDAAALDMESFGLYDGAHLHGVPALAVRGISDQVEGKTAAADAVRQPTAARNAASFLATILYEAQPEDVPRGHSGPTPKPDPLPEKAQLPPYVQLWEQRLRRASESRADSAIAELPKPKGTDGGVPLGTWLNRILHRPPRWLREDATGDGWALVAAVASAGASPRAAQAQERAAAAADAAGETTMAAVHRLWAALKVSDADNDGGGDRTAAAALRLLANDTKEHLGPIVDFYLAAADSDVEGMVTHAPDALVLVGQDPTRIGLPQGKALRRLDVEVEVQSLLACEILLSLSTAWLTSNSFSRANDAASGGSQVPSNPIVNDNASAALAAARAASELLPTSNPAKLLIAQAEMALLMGGLTRRPDLPDTSAKLQRIEQLALDVRESRLLWGGSSASALALAGRARAEQGDPNGALRMLLPAPDGLATPEEGGDSEVRRIAAAIAVSVGQSKLAIELCAKLPDQAEAALIRAGAMKQAGLNSDAVQAYREALEFSEHRIDILVRALFGLARFPASQYPAVEGLMEQYTALVRDHDVQTADLIEATSALSDGRLQDAHRLARQYPDSEIAVEIRVNALLNDGRAEAAVTLLDSHGIQRGDDVLRLNAMMHAGQAGLTEIAEKIAAELVGTSKGQVRQQAMEAKLHLARRSRRWAEVTALARQMLDELDAADARSTRGVELRWILAEVLYFQDQFEAAANVLIAPEIIPFDERYKVQLLLATIRGFIDTGATETINPILIDALMAAVPGWVTDDEVAAQALGVLLLLPAAKMSEGNLLQARLFSERFFADRPQSAVFKRISVADDDMTELFNYMKDQFEPREQGLRDLTNKIWLGQVPQAFVAAVGNRSYAESLVKQTIGCYVVSGDAEDAVHGRAAAAVAVAEQRAVADTSALVIGPKTGIKRSTLTAQFEKVLIPHSLRDDIVSARSSLAMRSTAVMGWDSREQRPSIVQYDQDVAEQWSVDADRLYDDIRLCTLVPDVEDSERTIWNSALLLAKKSEVALWADDLAIRNVARTLGVPAFSTLDLLYVAREHIRFHDDDVMDALKTNKIVDLALPDDWTPIAEQDAWAHNGHLARSIARPFAWRDFRAAFQSYTNLIRSMPASAGVSDVAQWAAHAASGLTWRTPMAGRPKASAALLAWTALNTDPIFDEFVNRPPPHDFEQPIQNPLAGRFLEAMLQIGDELTTAMFPGGDALGKIISAIAQSLRAGLDVAMTGRVMATVVSTLSDKYRGRALEAFLTTPISEDPDS